MRVTRPMLNLKLPTRLAPIVLGLLTFCFFMASCSTEVQMDKQHRLSTVPETPEAVNPIFVVSETLAGKAFDQYEKIGENQQKVTIGEEQSLEVSVQGIGTTERLKLAILFLTPMDHARKRGYEFGLVAKKLPPEQLKHERDAAVSQAVQNGRSVTFKIKSLAVPESPNISEPIIRFALLTKNGDTVSPTTTPTSFIPPEKDLITAVAWEQDGQDLTFSLYNGSSPNITSAMDKLTVVVIIDEQDRNLTFSLKRP